MSHTREILKALYDQDKGHLVQGIEYQLVMVEALEIDLKESEKHLTSQNIHHLHVIEEDLFHRENRIAEELSVILNNNTPKKVQTPSELIAQGEKLVASAKKELELIAHTKEAQSIENELEQVEKLIAAVKQNPSASNELADEQLTRHEISLNNLIKSAKSHSSSFFY